MDFQVIPHRENLPEGHTNKVFLLTDGWDDWFTYSTMYVVFYFDKAGEKHRIGEVKIGEFEMVADQRRPNIPDEFNELEEKFFSLGQDDSYYQKVNELGDSFRDVFLEAMRDVARDAELFERALDEKVTGVSLLRSVSDQSVRGQYRRMAQGGARLTEYAFSYTPPPWGPNNVPPTYKFAVHPESYPPTNVHVLIGRNNVGKTYTVEQMTNALVRPEEGKFGDFHWDEIDEFGLEEAENFSNIIAVTFSAFDPFEPLSTPKNKLSRVRYQYIGLKHIGQNEDGTKKPPKSTDDLAADFGKSVQLILTQTSKQERWRRALSLLESDPIFKQAEIWKLIETFEELKAENEPREAFNQLRKNARQLYSKLSSGHKIVVLTITRLVEALEERSLVLLDEPEAHLHPPLLSAFIRSLSDLLINRNGVAIIATHSPVILQEVPKTCVWRIWRSGREKRIERPNAETFGENVGTLTQEIFGLEVTNSGFHKMLSDSVRDDLTYEEVLARFNGQLGDVTCHGIFPPFGIRVRPKEGTDNEANEIHGRTDHQHSDRA
ncbi:AAA family ATPase [Roseinatronobacter sp. S2]|uniref:AAA family ATPase n=1 Tax=Roseinatronobacter sp. S2 TaxID=3035471 RepID=UPI002410126F|nr:AAA family ATPase [Roseinatronobacter sp. S2]WFE77164.1 AAA family ATPase [Roseinatronobacter sp. S2]